MSSPHYSLTQLLPTGYNVFYCSNSNIQLLSVKYYKGKCGYNQKAQEDACVVNRDP